MIPDDPHRTVYSVINPQEPSSCQVTIAEKNGSEKQSSLTREGNDTFIRTLHRVVLYVVVAVVTKECVSLSVRGPNQCVMFTLNGFSLLLILIIVSLSVCTVTCIIYYH